LDLLKNRRGSYRRASAFIGGHDLNAPGLMYGQGMEGGTLISMEEYLGTAYSSDREYVDGAVVERHVGEIPHGIVQSNVIFALRRKCPQLRAWPEVRVRTLAGRCRIPDVLVVADRPRTPILESAPTAPMHSASAGSKKSGGTS
jgi:hypothetical protein